MSNPYVWIWSTLIWGSPAWDAYQLFPVGWRGGHDILTLVRDTSSSANSQKKQGE